MGAEPSVIAKAASMKFLLLAFIPAVTGFTPSVGVMRHQSSALVQTNPRTAVAVMAKSSPADDLIGGDVETGGFWDPFNLASKPKADLVKYRTAELKHGRLAMLATLGFIVAELYQIPTDDGLFAWPPPARMVLRASSGRHSDPPRYRCGGVVHKGLRRTRPRRHWLRSARSVQGRHQPQVRSRRTEEWPTCYGGHRRFYQPVRCHWQGCACKHIRRVRLS